MADGPRYEDDFYAWTQHQADVLRSMPVSDKRFDREHVAEELEDLGKSERDAVRSQIRRIIEHLLKLAYSPAQQPRFDWMHTISDARAALEDKLSPTLRRDIEATLEKLYADGRRHAALALRTFGEETAAQAFPAQCPFSLEEICQQDWYPVSPGTEAG
jgi:Domain of unknown function DUF29